MDQTRTIGVITENYNGIFHTPLLDSLLHRLAAIGYRMLVIQSTPGELAASRIATQRVDGWIAINCAEDADRLLALGRPVVLISEPWGTIPCVRADNVGGAADAVAHLISSGRTRIAFFGYSENADFRERHRTYAATLAAHDLLNPRLQIDSGSYDVHHAYQRFRAWLLSGVSIDAVFCANDWLAFSAMRALAELQLRIPEDVAVVGYDDAPEGQLSIPPLSSVRQDPVEIGLTALRLLLDQIERGVAPPQMTLIPTQLIVRESSALSLRRQSPEALSARALGASWEDQLARDLAQCLVSRQIEPGVAAAEIWPGVDLIVGSLAACVSGTAETPPPPAVWQIGSYAMRRVDQYRRLLDLLRDAGLQALIGAGAIAEPRAVDRLMRWLQDASDLLSHHSLIASTSQSEAERQQINAEAQLLREMNTAGQSPRLIRWLEESFGEWGALALWPGDTPEQRGFIEIVSTYTRSGGAIACSLATDPSLFPPSDVVAVSHATPLFLKVAPIRSAAREWGYLACLEPLVWSYNDLTHNRQMFLATALELEQQTLGLRELTLRDSLTGLRNRRYISEKLPQLVSGAHYAQQPLALAIADIDHFKLINDTYSHDGGDRVLASFASLLCEWYPDEGGIVRLGGEEFAIILPGASHADALRRCEQLRALVERHAWDLVAPGLRVTVSIGLASIQPGDTDQTMLHRADLCLYAAKMQGRNQVTDQPLVLV